jgi:putative ABC transport system substrate-binding protein
LLRAGLLEGRDVVTMARYADHSGDRLLAAAAEVVQWRPVVLISSFHPRRAVAALAPDIGLVGMGLTDALAADLRRLQGPTARVTGIDMLTSTLNAKRLELLAECLPPGAAVLNFHHPLVTAAAREGLAALGQRLGLRMFWAEVNTPTSIDAAFDHARALAVQAVNVLASQPIDAQRAALIRNAQRLRLPMMVEWPDAVAEGALLSYGLHRAEFHDQIVRLAWRLASGEPAERLPLEQPTRLVLSLNARTAAAIGLNFPPALLARADEVLG